MCVCVRERQNESSDRRALCMPGKRNVVILHELCHEESQID